MYFSTHLFWPTRFSRSLLKHMWQSVWVRINFFYFDDTSQAMQGYRTEWENLLSIHPLSDYASLKGGGSRSSQAKWQVKKGRVTHSAELMFLYVESKREWHTHTQTHRTTPCQCDLPTCHKHIITGLQLEHYNKRWMRCSSLIPSKILWCLCQKVRRYDNDCKLQFTQTFWSVRAETFHLQNNT